MRIPWTARRSNRSNPKGNQPRIFTGRTDAETEAAILWPPNAKSQSESEVVQLCPTLCDPVDCSLSGFSVHGILQARILEWVTISFSRGSSDPGIEPGSPSFQADALTSEPPGRRPKSSLLVSFVFIALVYEGRYASDCWSFLST